MESKALGLRLRLHLAAHRRIDAAALGREVFLPCPAFLGEPHIACELADGLILKIGIVRMAHYWPKPEMAARSRAWCGNRALVEAVERRLFPLLPPPGPDAAHEFEVAAGVWILLQPLREFEARHCLPLFPYSTFTRIITCRAATTFESAPRRCASWAAATSRSPRLGYRLTSPNRSWTIARPAGNCSKPGSAIFWSWGSPNGTVRRSPEAIEPFGEWIGEDQIASSC